MSSGGGESRAVAVAAAAGDGPPALPPRVSAAPAHVLTPAELAKQKKEKIKATAERMKLDAIARIAARKAAEDAEDYEEEEEESDTAPAYEICLKILVQVTSAKSPTGLCYADMFRTLPMRHSSKGKKYFKQIAKPISFKDMFARCRKKYNTIAHLRLDFERLVDNTKKFYPWNSTEVKQIGEIQKVFYPLFLAAMAANRRELGYYAFPAADEYVEVVSPEVTAELETLIPLLAEPAYDAYEPAGRPYGPVALAEEVGRKVTLAKALAISTSNNPDWICFAKTQAEYDAYLAANEIRKPNLVAILRGAVDHMVEAEGEEDELTLEDPVAVFEPHHTRAGGRDGLGAMPGSAHQIVSPYHYPGSNTLTNVGGTFSSAY